jgi:hypothetical protein
MNQQKLILKIAGERSAVQKFVEMIEKMYPDHLTGPLVENDSMSSVPGVHCFITLKAGDV